MSNVLCAYRRAGWCRAAIASALSWLGVSAGAQQPITQTGQLFDANPAVGSGGLNWARPVSPLLPGNAITTGNVRGGLAFQGYSPIGNPNSFMAGLPSGTLSSFRRDSISVADAARGLPLTLRSPYFDVSRTAPTAGFLSGATGQPYRAFGPISNLSRLNVPDTGAPLDMRLDSRLNAGSASLAAPSAGVAALTQQITGLAPAGAGELGSSIFGLPTAAPPTATSGRAFGVTMPGPVQPLGPQQPALDPERLTQRPTFTPDPVGSRPPLGTPLELARSGAIQRLPIEPGIDPLAPPEQQKPLTYGPQIPIPETDLSRTRPAEVREPVLPQPPTLRDPSVLPGFDVFNDMQLARALSSEPSASWFEEMQRAIREDPVVAEVLREQADVQAQQFIQDMLTSPIQTFHGRGPSAKNNELLKAEALMEDGDYREAQQRYRAASGLDPLDPLPLVGLGNALLASGDYLSAATKLKQGFERYPDLARFSLDLPALIGGREIIDIRRADLMRRLQNRDDPQLRFLLGYLEYYSGDPGLRESGQQNLERAAELDGSGSIIGRFPDLLRQKGAVPPPALPAPDSVVPEPDPAQRPGRQPAAGIERKDETP